MVVVHFCCAAVVQFYYSHDMGARCEKVNITATVSDRSCSLEEIRAPVWRLGFSV